MDVIKDIGTIDQSLLPDTQEDILYIEQKLKEQGLEIPEPFLVPFCNHIFMMLLRIKENDFSALDISSQANDEIDGDVMQLSHEILAPLFSKENLEPNKVEEILFAFYIQAAKNSKGDERNE